MDRHAALSGGVIGVCRPNELDEKLTGDIAVSRSPKTKDGKLEKMVYLAKDVAPELSQVLLTHFPDAATLDVFRPGDTDLEGAQAINRAVAVAMADAGVEVIVQRADQAAFRRWTTEHQGKPQARLDWVDREKLLRWNAAMDVLGVQGRRPPPRMAIGKKPGPVADQVLEAYAFEDDRAFDEIVQEILQSERTDILDLAVRKMLESHGDEAAEDLRWTFQVAAEGANIGPSGWMELVGLPVALAVWPPPDGQVIVDGFLGAASQDAAVEVRLLPGWRNAETLASLSCDAVRRILLDLSEGREPADLPPGDTDDLKKTGFGVLIGCRTDWAIPVWDTIVAAGGLPPAADDDAEETPEEAARAELFDTWRDAVFEDSKGCVPLDLVAFSDVAEEIAIFLADAAEQTRGLNEIQEFVAMCRREAGGEDVVCRPEIIGDDLELTVYTRHGRFLDSLSMSANQLPAQANEMPKLIASFVDLIRDAPDR
jgi:hypothetical protein